MMFRDLEINEITANYIIVDALCLYFGGDALDKQEPVCWGGGEYFSPDEFGKAVKVFLDA